MIYHRMLIELVGLCTIHYRGAHNPISRCDIPHFSKNEDINVLDMNEKIQMTQNNLDKNLNRLLKLEKMQMNY